MGVEQTFGFDAPSAGAEHPHTRTSQAGSVGRHDRSQVQFEPS